MIFAFLLALTATVHPARPAVGDLIAIDFPAPVVLDASSDYELVSRQGNRVIVRTFEPRPFAVSGRMGNTTFRNMIVPVRSLLGPKDSMQPAPLKPPVVPPYPPLPFVLIGVAALLAALAWLAVWRLASRVGVVAAPALPPREQFRATVLALRDDTRAPRRWARLADATRAYLAATTDLGAELTTKELVGRTDDPTIAEILRQGDLEKFSPWGAMEGNFEWLADRALELAPEPVEEVAA